MLKGKRKGT